MGLVDLLTRREVTAAANAQTLGIPEILHTAISVVIGSLIGRIPGLVDILGPEASIGVAILVALYLVAFAFRLSGSHVWKRRPATDAAAADDTYTTAMDMTRWYPDIAELPMAYLRPYPIELADSAKPGLQAIRVVAPDNLDEVLDNVRGAYDNLKDCKPDRLTMQYWLEQPLKRSAVVEIVAKLSESCVIQVVADVEPGSPWDVDGIYFTYQHGASYPSSPYRRPKHECGNENDICFDGSVVSDYEVDGKPTKWKRIRFSINDHWGSEFGRDGFRYKGLQRIRASAGCTVSHWELS